MIVFLFGFNIVIPYIKPFVNHVLDFVKFIESLLQKIMIFVFLEIVSLYIDAYDYLK